MKLFRLLPLSAALAVTFVLPAQAQSLVDLYNAAKGFDASYQSAKLQFDASLAKAEQALAGTRPSAGLSMSANLVDLNNNKRALDRKLWQLRRHHQRLQTTVSSRQRRHRRTRQAPG